MKKQKLLIAFIGLAQIGSISAFAATKLDTDASYSCTVLESNDKNVRVGSVTLDPVTVKSILTGVIHFKSGADVSMIDFYGTLNSYDLYAENSEMQVFSSPPMEQREIHGTILVNEAARGVELAVKLFPTTRAFDRRGKQEMVLADSPNVYKLSCSKL